MSRPVAVVTGGRRGIGLAIGEALARAGFDIGIADRADDGDAVEAIRALRAQACFAAFDLADLASHDGAIDAIEDGLGPIDVLVNNAGIAAPVRGDLLDLKPEDFDTVIDVNLRGTIFFSQAVAKRMLTRPSPHPRSIVTITSVSAAMASPERTDYCISKAGLSMFVKNLALRLAPAGIGVFEVRPGIIRSDMTAGVTEKYDRLIGEGLVPAGRWGEGDDIGRVVAALASGGFGFSTGSVIDVDGGLAIPRF